MASILRDFGLNASVLLSLTLFFFLFVENLSRRAGSLSKTSNLSRELVYGLFLAVIGLLIMATPVYFGPGVVFDSRTILIGLAAAFFGWLPASLAALACALFRISQGGAGTLTGVTTIMIALIIGLLWRHWRGKDMAQVRLPELYGLGFVIHLFVVGAFLILLADQRGAILRQIAPVFLICYPLIFAAVALLMQHRYRLEVTRRELDRSRECYRNLFLNNHLPMFLIDPEDGSIVDANPASESLYGWTREELLRMRVCELDALKKPEVDRMLIQARDSEVNEFECQHRLHDGSLREVLVRSGPVEIEGRLLLYTIIADQTESKRLTSALRESEARAMELVSAVERCHVSIIFTNLDGYIEYVNPYFCSLTGYTADEVLGRQPDFLDTGKRSQASHQAIRQTINAGQVWEGELCNRCKDGTLVWEDAVIIPIKNSAGELEKFVEVKHNITAKKEHAQALEAALREARAGIDAKAAFLSVISHELHTPLHHILAPCEMVAEDLPAGEQKELLQTAINAARHLSELVHRVIRFSEVSGESESPPQLIEDPQDWIKCAVQSYSDLAQEKGSTLKVSISQNFPTLFTADEVAVSEALAILIDNALEHADPGTIRVELSCENPDEPKYARLAVIDPGPMISDAHKENLFQPFQQLDMSSTRVHKGIGLGLCLCRRYAERCGGTLELKKDSSGGNCFEFVFPISLETILV